MVADLSPTPWVIWTLGLTTDRLMPCWDGPKGLVRVAQALCGPTAYMQEMVIAVPIGCSRKKGKHDTEYCKAHMNFEFILRLVLSKIPI